MFDISGSKSLNNKLIEITGNYMPDLIILGHADQILKETLIKIKKFYPSIKFCQWFLDKMDDKKWKVNRQRFEKIISHMDASFCTTHPSSIKLSLIHI